MSIITENFSIEDKIITVIKHDYQILSAKILVSKYPVLALAKRENNFFIIEYICSNNSEYINDHIVWFYSNIYDLKNRFQIPAGVEEKVIFIITEDGELNIEIPNLQSDVEFFLYHNDNLTVFQNYVLNLGLYYRFLEEIKDKKLKKKFNSVVDPIIDTRPVICYRKGENYLRIIGKGEEYDFYFLKTKILYHKGRAPFTPITISS